VAWLRNITEKLDNGIFHGSQPQAGGMGIGVKCFMFQINHPILGCTLAPTSADKCALGTLGIQILASSLTSCANLSKSFSLYA
jgi:hypothetical protein